MTTTTVSNTADLLAAMRAAAPGDTILLNAGTYSAVGLYSVAKAGTVTIQSADPTNPATLTDLTMAGDSGFAFNDLNFAANGGAVVGSGPQFNILSSQNISLTNLDVYGNPAGSLATSNSGIYVKGSTNVSVTNSVFSYLNTGITQTNNSQITISGNQFSNLYTDGIDGGGDAGITISNNTFTSLGIDPTNPLHSDAIQFWTVNTTVPGSNITINGNTYTRGTGTDAHGIYMNDNTLNKLPFTNVVIENNNIAGSGYDGISVYDGKNITLTDNTVTSYADQLSWITVQTGNVIDVTGNSAEEFLYTSTDKHLTQSNNTITAPIPIPTPSLSLLVSSLAAFGTGEHAGVVGSAIGHTTPAPMTLFAARA